jgi:carboxyl-terminal processing protease
MISSRFRALTLAGFSLLLVYCGSHRTSPGWQSRDADYLFASRFLYRYFIFQDRLPPDPLAFPSATRLYQHVNEPYTVYLPGDIARQVLSSLETRTSGLGVLLDPVHPAPVITKVLTASPAATAGLGVGDTLLSIDGVELDDLPLEGLVKLLRGEVGTVRNVLVGRPGTRVSLSIPLTSFLAPSVFTDSITGTVAYIYITSFLSTSEGLKGTRQEFVDALLETSWASTILLDLRGNSGGELNQSVAVARALLPHNAAIIRIIERVFDTMTTDGFTRDTIYRATDDGAGTHREVVLLMDRFTASGAELVIAALRDNRPDLILVGGTTLGKGRAQVLALSPNSSLARVTNALLLPVRSASYDGEGIAPTIPTIHPSATIPVATEAAQRLSPDPRPPSEQSLRRIAFIRALYGPDLELPLASTLWRRPFTMPPHAVTAQPPPPHRRNPAITRVPSSRRRR